MLKKIKQTKSEKLLLIFLILLAIFSLISFTLIKNKCLFVEKVNLTKLNFNKPENIVILNVTCGNVVIELYPSISPNSVERFKKLVKNKEGCIINIIDQRVEKLTPFFFSYTLSKSSLATFTKTSAMKLAPNIRVNGISPGPTLKNKRQSEAHFKKQWKSTLLRKKVDLDNICNGVRFFIENKSITGEIINIDSGQRLAWQTPDIINTKE